MRVIKLLIDERWTGVCVKSLDGDPNQRYSSGMKGFDNEQSVLYRANNRGRADVD